MADVDAAQVAQLVDSSDTPTDRALALSDVAISVVTRFARSYTRGRGFDQFGPDEDIAAVITTASARLAQPTRRKQSRASRSTMPPGRCARRSTAGRWPNSQCSTGTAGGPCRD